MLQARKYSWKIARALSGCYEAYRVAARSDAGAYCATVCDGHGLSRHIRRMSVNTASQSITFSLAQPGEGIHECEILQWHVEVGCSVEEFDPLLEVQSDKANVEITSPYTGVIQARHGSVGDMIKVGGPLVDIQVDGPDTLTLANTASNEQPDSSLHSPPQQQSADVSAQSSPPGSPSTAQEGSDGCADERKLVLASPAVRALAREHGLDLATISGSGPDGRVLKEDVLGCLGAGASEVSGPPVPNATLRPGVCDTTDTQAVIPLRGYRRAMVHSMTAATAVPHFHLCDDVQLDALIATRDTLRASMHDIKLSLLPLLIKTLSVALTKHPEVNARLGKDLHSLELIRNHNVGIAIATDSGLVVPCIRAVQDLSVRDIAARLDELKRKAHQGQLQPEDFVDTSITVSNVGVIGGRYATPIVNTPQLAICALGRLRKGFVFSNGDQPEVANLMSVSWGADHRALDGAALARFNNTWKYLMQNPVSMLLHTK